MKAPAQSPALNDDERSPGKGLMHSMTDSSIKKLDTKLTKTIIWYSKFCLKRSNDETEKLSESEV